MSSIPVRVRRVNPAKPARKLSARQIKYFGTPRQKSALKAKRTRAFAKPKSKHSSRPAPKRNVGEIITAGLAGLNPASRKGETTMTKSRKKSGNQHRSRAQKHNKAPARKPNPAMQFKPRHHKRNPSVGGVADLGIQALFGLGGAFGTSVLAQTFLGPKNTGVWGYGVSLALALGLGWGATMFPKLRKYAAPITVGGLAGLGLRILREQTPYGAQINAQLTQAGVGDLTGFSATTFFAPLQEAPGSVRGNQLLPAAVQQQQQVAAVRPAGMNGGRLMKSRYN